MSENSNQLIYKSVVCSDFDQFSVAANKWSLDFKQLDSGSFNSEFSLIDTGPILLSSFKISRQIEQQCLSPFGYQNFGILADPKQSFFWRGQTINGNDIVIVPKSREVEAMCFPGFKYYTISIKKTWLENFIQAQGEDKPSLLDSGLEVLHLNKKSISKIRNLLQLIFFVLDREPQYSQNEYFLNWIVEPLSTALLDITKNYTFLAKKPPKRVRDVALLKALDYIHDGCIDWPSISKLSEIAGASQRTLEYAFNEKYGFGPKEYLIKHHLNNVHKTIKKSDPSTTIKDIAYDFGFWHMSQFSAYYKRLFGELPSTTIAKVG